jgi:hypothetical protein
MLQTQGFEGRRGALDRRRLIQAGLIGAFCLGPSTLCSEVLPTSVPARDDSVRLMACLRAVWAAHEQQASGLSVKVIRSPFLLADASAPRLVKLSSGFVAACGGSIRTGAWFSQALASLEPGISSPDADRLALTVFGRAGYDPRLFVALWQGWSISSQLTDHGPKGDWPVSVARRTALTAEVRAMGYLL